MIQIRSLIAIFCIFVLQGFAFSHPAHHDQKSELKEASQISPGVKVIPFSAVKSYSLNGNQLQGLATASQGAKTHEVWRSIIAPGSRTPKHMHTSEEVFVFLTGKGKIIAGDETVEFEAPCTVIAPANVPHQVVNTGDVPTEQIVIVTVGSHIRSQATGKLMKLPWRL